MTAIEKMRLAMNVSPVKTSYLRRAIFVKIFQSKHIIPIVPVPIIRFYPYFMGVLAKMGMGMVGMRVFFLKGKGCVIAIIATTLSLVFFTIPPCQTDYVDFSQAFPSGPVVPWNIALSY